MMRTGLKRAMVAAVLVAAGAVGQASADNLFFRLREIRRHALVSVDGVVDRFQFHYFSDPAKPNVCILMVRDQQTEQFSITEARPETCAPVMIYDAQ